MADEIGFGFDEEGFKNAMNEQRERARSSSKQKKSALSGDIYTEGPVVIDIIFEDF